MKISMETIVKAREEVLAYHQKREDRQVTIMPMQENFWALRVATSGQAAHVEYPIQLATVKFEDYGELILEVRDPPELEALRAKVAELEKERKWIDVIKELPKATMSVLVTNGTKVGELTYVKYVDGTGKWLRNNKDITAWMLKPKSPESLKDKS
jgi:hypothetical protein